MSYGPDAWSRPYRWTAEPTESNAPPAAPNPALSWIDIRINAMLRMHRLAFNHGRVATERPKGRLPGPHALALLYASPSPASTARSPRYDLFAATRMFPDSDDTRPQYNVRDGAQLLRNMVEIAMVHHRAGGFDPLSLTDRAEAMPHGASFVGVGLSSLGRPEEEWGAARGYGVRLYSHCHIRLVDGSWLEMWRDAETSQSHYRCNRMLGYVPSFVAEPMIPEDYRPAPGGIHHWMDHLTAIIDTTYNELQQPSSGGGQRTRSRPSAHA